MITVKEVRETFKAAEALTKEQIMTIEEARKIVYRCSEGSWTEERKLDDPLIMEMEHALTHERLIASIKETIERWRREDESKGNARCDSRGEETSQTAAAGSGCLP